MDEAPVDRNRWGTPTHILEAAREVLGTIDLDPCSEPFHQERVGASNYYTEYGETKPWYGRVWCNPPYSQPLCAQFVDRFLHPEFCATNAGLLLINVSTASRHWQRLLRAQLPVCFIVGRLAFVHPDPRCANKHQNRHDSAVFYTGPNTRRFREVFCALGALR